MQNLAIMLLAAVVADNAFGETQSPIPQPAEVQAVGSSGTFVELPEPASRQQFKILSKVALKEVERESKKDIRAESLKLPTNPRAPKRPAAENVQLMDEIRVFSSGDPEDYVAPKPPPMLVFRATLDKQRPRTIADTLRALCLICPIAAPREGNILDRTDERKGAAPARMSGTLQ